MQTAPLVIRRKPVPGKQTADVRAPQPPAPQATAPQAQSIHRSPEAHQGVNGTQAQSTAASLPTVNNAQSLSPCFRNQLPPQRQAEFDQAVTSAITTCKRLVADGLPEDAIVLGNAFLNLEPALWDLQLLLADVYWKQENWDKCMTHYLQATRLFGAQGLDVERKYRLLECLTLVPGKEGQALRYCQDEKILVDGEELDFSIGPLVYLQTRLIAAVLRVNGRAAEAERYIKLLVDRRETLNEQEKKELGKIAFELGRYVEAIECLGTDVMCNESACAMYKLERYYPLSSSFWYKGVPEKHDPNSAIWVAAAHLEIPMGHWRRNICSELFARMAIAAGCNTSDAKDILQRVLNAQGVSSADWKQRFMGFLNSQYNKTFEKFESTSKEMVWVAAYSLYYSDVRDELVYKAMHEKHKLAMEIDSYPTTGVVGGTTWYDALNRDGAKDNPGAFRAWMSTFFTGSWAWKAGQATDLPLCDVIPLYLVQIAPRVLSYADGLAHYLTTSQADRDRKLEVSSIAGPITLNAFESNPVNPSTLYAVIDSSGWGYVDDPVRSTGKTSTQIQDEILDYLLNRCAWGRNKQNRIKALQFRACINKDSSDLAASKHWPYAEELAALKGNYWELFSDMEALNGTAAALAWAESNRTKMPPDEYKRLIQRGKETIKDRKKAEKNKVKWAKAAAKREAIERSKGPVAPAWMQEKSRQISEQMLRDQISWRNFNQ